MYKYLAVVLTPTSESTRNPAHHMPAACQKITASYHAMHLDIPRHASYHYNYGLWYKCTTSAFFHRYHCYIHRPLWQRGLGRTSLHAHQTETTARLHSMYVRQLLKLSSGACTISLMLESGNMSPRPLAAMLYLFLEPEIVSAGGRPLQCAQ